MFREKGKFIALGLIAFGLVTSFDAAAIAAHTGSISGTVQSANGELIAYANIILVDTDYGAMTLADGRFRINRVPAGTYTIRVLMMGFKSIEKKSVQVTQRDTAMWFVLERTIVAKTQAIAVTAERLRSIDPQRPHQYDYSEVDDLLEAVALRYGAPKSGAEMRL